MGQGQNNAMSQMGRSTYDVGPSYGGSPSSGGPAAVQSLMYGVGPSYGGGMNNAMSHIRTASQQNRMNSTRYNQNTGGFTQGSAMPRGRRGGVGRGHLRGGTGDQMQSWQTNPGMTTIRTPDFMRELGENFGNSPWGRPGNTMQVERAGGGRGYNVPIRQEVLQNRLNQAAIRNAAGQSRGIHSGSFGNLEGLDPGIVDPYMVEQAFGQGNWRQPWGNGISDDGTFSAPAMANRYDLNFDGGVGADDLVMANAAQSAGRAYEPMDTGRTLEDLRAEIDREQGIRDQYGAQEMQARYSPFDPRPIDDLIDLGLQQGGEQGGDWAQDQLNWLQGIYGGMGMGQVPLEVPGAPRRPRPGTGLGQRRRRGGPGGPISREFIDQAEAVVGGSPWPSGSPHSDLIEQAEAARLLRPSAAPDMRGGRIQSRGLRRPGGRGRRQFGLGGIVDAYGRRLI